MKEQTKETQVQVLIRGDTVTMPLSGFVDLIFPIIADRIDKATSVSLQPTLRIDGEQLAKEMFITIQKLKHGEAL